MTDLLIGGGIGFASATIGALLQYRISRTRDQADEKLPGCIFLVMGALGVIGIIMFALSLILTGTTKLALIPGLGVMAGFFLGFTFIFSIWLVWIRRQRIQRKRS